MNRKRIFESWLSIAMVLAIMIAASPTSAVEPIEIGSPERIEVLPAEFKLNGQRDRLHMIVTGYYASGEVQDLTTVAQFTTSNAEVAVAESSIVQPTGNGQAVITVIAGGKEATMSLEVAGQKQPQPISFLYGTLPALSKQGCNAGACHGSPSGKGSFRLSLRAFDPVLDELTLIREEYGRRTNPVEPDSSLLLLKPLMKVPHGGGMQIHTNDPAYEVIRTWIAEGCLVDPDDSPKCVGIEILPPTGRVLKYPAQVQSLCVLAKFSDGSIRDITEMAVFSSSDTKVATVDASGLVVGQDRGEAAVIVRYLEFIESSFLTFVKDIEGYEWSNPPEHNYIDSLVDAKLQQLQFLPSELCTEEEFVRRVYLDVIGLLPSVEEVQAYLSDESSEKRSHLIDALLERPEYAKFWALKWGDLLRMTSGRIGKEGVHKYHRWVERSIEQNMPYDKFARQLLTASGSTLTNPAANFYRTAGDMNECVETISQIFLGARMTCAKCHNHPFERWSQDNYYGLGAFFNRVQRKKTQRAGEQVIWSAAKGEVKQPRTGKTMTPWLPLAGDQEETNTLDRRITFADWLTKPENPFFAKIGANRIWSQLIGRGIVEPSDDFRESNPASNAVLLDALAEDFATHGFDSKHIARTILNSRTYQTAIRTNSFNEDDVKYFSHRVPHLLSAEQLLDAICSVTEVSVQFASLPASTKATQLPAPDISSNSFLKAIGQPERQTVCECERSEESNLGMALQFLNGPLISGQIRKADNRFRKLIDAGQSSEKIVQALHLAAFSRQPSEGEMKSSLEHIAAKEIEVATENARLDEELKKSQAAVAVIRTEVRGKLLITKLETLPEPLRADTQAALATAKAQRDPVQNYLVEKLGALIQVTDEEITASLTDDNKKQLADLEAQVAKLNAKKLPVGRIVGLEDICWVLLNRNEFLFNH